MTKTTEQMHSLIPIYPEMNLDKWDSTNMYIYIIIYIIHIIEKNYDERPLGKRDTHTHEPQKNLHTWGNTVVVPRSYQKFRDVFN